MSTKSFWFHIKSLLQTLRIYKGTSSVPQPVDIQEHHEKMLKELPIWIKERGIGHLVKLLSNPDKIRIKLEYEKDNKTWWAFYHHGWGTAIRNSLRDNVCLDDKLPSKNWDDYYIPLVEIAVGVRKP